MLVTSWALALLSVLFVSGGVFGYASAAHGIARGTRVPAALGLGLFATVVVLVGLAGGYTGVVETLVVVSGYIALYLAPEYPLELWRARPRPRGWDWLWLALPLVYALTRFFSAGLPQQHSDPLYYHLSAPRLWAELHQIRLTPEHPSYAQAALWEALYGFPQFWFGTHGAIAHVITQLYGQWMHFLWGQGGCLVLSVVLLRRLAPPLRTRLGLAVFLGWLATTQPAFEWLGGLAKNDYVIAFFVLAGLLEALERRWLTAGVLLGFAFSTKVLAAWAGLALLVFIPWRSWPRYIAGGALAAAPFLLRNLVWTRNPLFPNLDDVIGPHWVSTLWKNHNASFGGGPRFDTAMFGWLSSQMFMHALPKLLLALGAVALALEAYFRRDVSDVRPHTLCRKRWLAFVGIQVALAFLMLRPPADGRYGSIAAIAAAIFALAAVVREAARWRPVWRFGAPVLLALGLFINSPVDQLVKIPRDYLFEPSVHYVEQFHPVFDMERWVQAHLDPREKVLFTAEKALFYLDRPFDCVSEMKKWETELTPIRKLDDLFALLNREGIHYVHFSPQWGGYPDCIRGVYDEAMRRRGEAVFASATSLIFKTGASAKSE